MLTGPFLPRNWLGSADKIEESSFIMVGLPYDGTCSFRPGARFAPQEIRLASHGLETYSPVLNRDLFDLNFYDAGELDFAFGNREDTLFKIERAAGEIFGKNKKWLGVGGEHLVTLPAVKACYEKHPDLNIIQFDAHADLADDYMGEKLSHATVIKRISEFILPENIIQTGIRSGTKEEYDWMKKNKTFYNSNSDFSNRIEKIGSKPVYLTIDLDILDPSIFSGTGTPEPGGLFFKEFIERLNILGKLNIVGADVVELSPHYDASGVSTITAAKIIREILLLFS